MVRQALLLMLAAAAAAAPSPHCFLSVKARAGDTCASIAAVFNVDAAAFRRMNPGVADCAHLAAGASYCIADDGAAPAPAPPKPSPKPSPSPAPPPKSPTQPTPPTPPTPHQSPITPACRKWHLVGPDDTCRQVEASQGVSDRDFRAWNGFINAACTNLWLGYYCCVGV